MVRFPVAAATIANLSAVFGTLFARKNDLATVLSSLCRLMGPVRCALALPFPIPPFRSVKIMFRTVAILCAAISACTSTVSAQDIQSMFPVRSHNFGDVAVAAKTEFRFPVRNTTGRTMQIQEVRTSCGCTTPIVETHTIQPGQTGSILAKFNTGTHRGQRGANLTVVVTQPFYTEVRLRVDGFIRQDLVFNPGAIEFGQQSLGQDLTQTAKIMYAGRGDWAVVDVLSNKPWVSVSLGEPQRQGQNVQYELVVTVSKDAPAGVFRDELVLVTNDRSRPRVPFLITGELENELSIAPQAIAGGELHKGETIERRLVIRGKRPFVIDSIEAEGWNLEYEPSDKAGTTHIINVRFSPAGASTGRLASPVVVKTSGELQATTSAILTAVVAGDPE